MDTEPTSFEEFDGYLRDLERINVLTLAYRPTLAKSAPWSIFREGGRYRFSTSAAAAVAGCGG
jgi:putative cofactor-binding repeat protein